MLSFYCLHLCYNNQISDFKIAIYDDHYHPFDDIVIDISTEITEKYAIQLKHVKDKLVLNSNHFGNNGKMVLKKFFKFDFTKSDHVVLLTNGVVNEEMTIGEYLIKHKMSLSFLEKCLDTSSEEKEHIFEISLEGQKITFFTCQKSRNEIDIATKGKLKDKFDLDEKSLDSVLAKFKSFFLKWKKEGSELFKLDKQDIKMKLAEILSWDSIIDFSPIFEEEIDSKIKIFQNVLKNFNLIFAGDVSGSFGTLCRFDLDKSKLIEYAKNLLVTNFENADKNLSVILWRMKEFPLPVKITEENERVIYELINDLRDEHLNFILFGKVSKLQFSSLKILENLDDLKSNKLYESDIKNFKLSIQGREDITLEELLACNKNFGEIITIRELFQILQGDFRMGEPLEELPQSYISRRLLTPILKIKTIEHFPNDLFAVTGEEKILKEVLPKNKFWKFEYWNKTIDNRLPPKSIILCKDPKNFDTCLRFKNSNVHCLKILDKDYLQLISSKTKSEKLRKFQIFSENKILKLVKTKINLICARPGMGKLTMLKFLKNSVSKDYWTVKIDLQEECQDENLSEFDKKVKNCFKEVERLVYFIYGIDNLQNENLEKAVNKIKQLSSGQIWVFSEDHMKETLEKLLEVAAMEIEEFSEDEQQKYIQERLEQRQDVEKVLFSFKMLRNNDILGAPMHLFMLTEIFKNNPEMEKVFILTDIYRYFIKTKYKHYLSKVSSESNNQIIEDGIFYRNEQYKLAAISCLDYFKKYNIQCNQSFLTQIKNRGDVIGIIFKVSTDGGIIFSQQTFSDYFAALWLAENYQKVKNLDNLVHREDFKNIFFMFNLEICKDNPAHISVLYQNFEELQKYEDFFAEVDSLQRSVLHLACLNGSNEENTRRKENNRILDLLVDNVEIDPLQVDQLFGWNLFDYAFNMSNFYALEKLLSKYENTEEIVLEKFQCFGKTDLEAIIFSFVKFGYKNLLRIASKTEIFSSDVSIEDCNGESLLHLAVKSGNYQNVCLLLDQGAKIDTTTNTYNKQSPLHTAVEECHLEIINLLLSRGASVDIKDRYRNTPLHLAASQGLFDAAKTLITFGADIDFANNFGRTALQLAATFGYFDLVKMLLDRGANIDKSDKFGNTALKCACDKKHLEIYNLLVKRGARNDIKGGRRPLASEFEYYTKFPLHWAAFTGQIERINSLLKDGWFVDQVDNFGRTPLYRAVTEKFLKVVEVLLEHKADVTIADNNRIVPLNRAIYNDDSQMTEILLSRHVGVDFKDRFNYTSLHLAALNGNVEIVKLLLAKNPDVDVVDNFGRKPVDCAVENGHFEIVVLLDGSCAKVEVAKKMGNFWKLLKNCTWRRKDLEGLGISLKHLAAIEGKVDFLERQKLDEDIVDICGNTALDWACKKGYVECVEVLIGCNSVAKAIQGDFLDMVKKQEEFVKVLNSF